MSCKVRNLMQESHLIRGIDEHIKLLVKVVCYKYLLVLMKQNIFIVDLHVKQTLVVVSYLFQFARGFSISQYCFYTVVHA